MENAGRELEDAELKASLKDAGIGTPATRAAIIETLFARQYIVREKRNIIPTEKGLAVYRIVKDKKIADVEMTGMWETALDRSGLYGCRHIQERHRGLCRPNHGGTAFRTTVHCWR